MIRVMGEGAEIFEPLAETAFSILKLKGSAVISVTVINDAEMLELNTRTRGIEKATDVLSYPAIKEIKPFTKANYPYCFNPEYRAVQIGDIAINRDAAARQSEEYGTGEREVKYLFVHGLLHVLGFDHMNDEDKAAMRKVEEAVLNAPTRLGFFTIAGRPNAGKSSLVNAMVGARVSIVSPRAQTTRDNIRGVCTEGNVQMVFTDTPGSFTPRNKLDEYMARCIRASYDDVDGVIVVLDATKGFTEPDREFISARLKGNPAVYVVVNKVDLAGYERVYPILTQLSEFMAEAEGRKAIKEVIPVSCRTGENVDTLKEILKEKCNLSEFLFERDEYTDRSARFIASEIVREKALLFLQKEIPHGIAVVIASYDESKTESDKLVINADIIVERKSHKPIVIGDGGEKIKRIGMSARKELEEVLGEGVDLRLFVKVRPDWRDNTAILTELSYRKKRGE